MFAGLVALALTASPAWGAFNLSAGGGISQFQFNTGSHFGLAASQQLFFAGGLVDDREPRAFQLLTQQLPTLTASGSYQTSSANQFSGQEIGGSVSGTIYPDLSYGMSAGLSVEQFHETVGFQNADFLEPDLSMFVGGATPRSRLWLGVDLSQRYVDGQGSQPLACLSLSGGSLFHDLFWIGAGVRTIRSGGQASIDAELAPTHATDFELSGFAERGQIYINSSNVYVRFGGEASAAVWLREVRVALSYGLSSAQESFENGFGDSEVVQGASLSFEIRLN